MTVIRPSLSQHFTVSPPTPMTRLIRSCSSSDGSSPMKVSASFTCLTTTGESFSPTFSCFSQWPGSLKTTTSPRCGLDPNQGVSLSTSTRSPTRMVCSIDPDGITKACTRKVLSTSAISSATMIRSGISRTAELRRRRLTLRASLRRSALVGNERETVGRLPVGSGISASAPPRRRPRLPMGPARRACAGEGAAVRQRAEPSGRPADPVHPADHHVHRDHAAARLSQVVA